MFRRSTKRFLHDNNFSIIMIFLLIILAGVCCIMCGAEKKTARKPTPAFKQPVKTNVAKSNENKFIITCFDHNLGMRCKSKKIGGHCSLEFQRKLQKICADLEALGIAPLDKIVVNIKKYDVCDKEMEEKTGCVPYFSPEGRIRGYNMASIYLPGALFQDSESLRTTLIHEITHALTFKYPVMMTRVVREFFAVYAESLFCHYNLHNICNGPEWNQSALRNYSGEYSFPLLQGNKPMRALGSCRYGQLEYIARSLHKNSPFLFKELWRAILRHKNNKMDTVWLKEQIAKIDSKSGASASRFHIFNQADASPQLAVAGNVFEHCVFIFKNISVSEEHYDARSGFQLKWRRGAKHMAWSMIAHAPIFCYSADKFFPGDTIDIRAVGFGKSFHRVFVVP